MALLQMPMTGTCSWEAASADPRSDDELTEAVGYFRRVLREAWTGWAKGWPLATYFDTSFQNGPREWVRLYRLIKALEGAPGLDDLVQSDLGSSAWTEYLAAVMTLEFCGRLRQTGREVTLIETAGQPAPADAIVGLVERPVTVEFKALHEAEQQQKWNDLLEWVSLQLGSSASEIDVWCEPSALENREALIADLMAVRSGRSPSLVQLPSGTGRARYTGLNVMGWSSPERERPDHERLVSKLRTKWWRKFHGLTTPSLLVVRTGMLFGQTWDGVRSKAEQAATGLLEAFGAIHGLGGVVIYDDPFLPPLPPVLLQSHHFRLSAGSMNGSARIALAVPNPGATIPLTAEELDLLIGPRMLW